MIPHLGPARRFAMAGAAAFLARLLSGAALAFRDVSPAKGFKFGPPIARRPTAAGFFVPAWIVRRRWQLRRVDPVAMRRAGRVRPIGA